MKKKQEERFQNNSSYRNMLTQIMGPKGWFWDEAQLSGMYSHRLHAFRCSPLAHIQVPITLLIHDKKSFRDRLLLQQELKLHFVICKALAVRNMEKVWITSCLETYIFLPSGHHGYGSSSFCWIITAEWIGMWFILNQLVFNRVYKYIRFQFCPIFSACLKKQTRVHLPLLTFADLLSIGSKQSLLKIKIRCERPTGELCCGFERHKKWSFPERAWNIFLSITV